jgi:hypothetical protein
VRAANQPDVPEDALKVFTRSTVRACSISAMTRSPARRTGGTRASRDDLVVEACRCERDVEAEGA